MRIHPQEASTARWNPAPLRPACLLSVVLAVAWGLFAPGAKMACGQIIPADGLELRTTDLIRLTTSHTDVVGEVKIAKLRVDTLTLLQQSSVTISALEVAIAKVQLETAQRKELILRAIAEKELAAAKAKLKVLEQLEAAAKQFGPDAVAAEPKPAIVQAKMAVYVLELILATK